MRPGNFRSKLIDELIKSTWEAGPGKERVYGDPGASSILGSLKDELQSRFLRHIDHAKRENNPDFLRIAKREGKRDLPALMRRKKFSRLLRKFADSSPAHPAVTELVTVTPSSPMRGFYPTNPRVKFVRKIYHGLIPNYHRDIFERVPGLERRIHSGGATGFSLPTSPGLSTRSDTGDYLVNTLLTNRTKRALDSLPPKGAAAFSSTPERDIRGVQSRWKPHDPNDASDREYLAHWLLREAHVPDVQRAMEVVVSSPPSYFNPATDAFHSNFNPSTARHITRNLQGIVERGVDPKRPFAVSSRGIGHYTPEIHLERQQFQSEMRALNEEKEAIRNIASNLEDTEKNRELIRKAFTDLSRKRKAKRRKAMERGLLAAPLALAPFSDEEEI